MFENRMDQFRVKLDAAGIDVAFITDEDNVYYLTGYYDYLHMEFGRPTILAVQTHAETTLITPTIDLNTALSSARVDRVCAWNDGSGEEWRAEIPSIVNKSRYLSLEEDHMPSVVRRYIHTVAGSKKVVNASPILSSMRRIKSAEELQMARHAGEVANAMMNAGRAVVGDGVAEFEVALVTAEAGTRKAAELLSTHYSDADMSPNIHFLQIMASGDTVTKTHHRASTRIMRFGEPVFLCFCGMTSFHRFKLGFDRTFWIGEITDTQQVDVYQTAVDSQSAALSALKPGVTAESVHAAYAEVIQDAGYDYPFRCGRATGFSYLEDPQLVTGDKSILEPGMVLAVDGSVSVDSFRAQVGDSFVITDDGFEPLTEHPKSLEDVIL